MLGGPNTRNLQQMRAADRACRNDDLACRGCKERALAAPELHAATALAIECEAADQRIGFDAQVWSASGRGQKGTRRRGAKASAPTVLRIANAFLSGAIVVGCAWKTGVLRRLNEAMGCRQNRPVFL